MRGWQGRGRKGRKGCVCSRAHPVLVLIIPARSRLPRWPPSVAIACSTYAEASPRCQRPGDARSANLDGRTFCSSCANGHQTIRAIGSKFAVSSPHPIFWSPTTLPRQAGGYPPPLVCSHSADLVPGVPHRDRQQVDPSPPKKSRETWICMPL